MTNGGLFSSSVEKTLVCKQALHTLQKTGVKRNEESKETQIFSLECMG